MNFKKKAGASENQQVKVCLEYRNSGVQGRAVSEGRRVEGKEVLFLLREHVKRQPRIWKPVIPKKGCDPFWEDHD